MVGSCYPSKKSFEFSTPNLKHLRWLGNFGTRVELGKLAGLERAEISSTCGVVDFDVLFCVLHCIRRVRVLILNDEIVKVVDVELHKFSKLNQNWVFCSVLFADFSGFLDGLLRAATIGRCL